ncbi:MAG: HAMP domain-containing sensor histidine kinase [Rubrivivax sp.]
MRSLYLRIWLTVVASLALFALVSGWLVQRHLEQERVRADGAQRERLEAWGDLLQRSLPAADAPEVLQAAGVQEWSQRLRLPLALDGPDGHRIGTADSYARRESDPSAAPVRGFAIPLDDGRTLWVMRRRPFRRHLDAWPDGVHAPGAGASAAAGSPSPALRFGRPGDARDRGSGPRSQRREAPSLSPLDLPGVPDGVVLLALLALLFAAVAAGAWPVVRRLTRRLESLKQGVEAFGAGALHHRVAVEGRDEVAAVAASFNHAASQVEALLRSHQSLLANASHELRSPLARLKMALAMVDDAAPAERAALQAEVSKDIAELDALVEEVLLASRLDAQAGALGREPVDLLALLAEEGARTGADVQGQALTVSGEERLLRRALRNLLENAERYGGGGVEARVGKGPGGLVHVEVCDRGPGVPEAYRERIFEPFFRLPGHAEHAGGVGLGLALVRQIARRHGGSVECRPREGGGSCFILLLPLPAG